MAVFWVVFNKREQSAKQVGKEAAGSLATVAPQKTALVETDAAFSGQIEDACVIKLEGSSLTTFPQAAEAVRSLYPGLMNGHACVVSNSNFKEQP